MEARKEALLFGIADLRERAELFAAKVAPLYVLLSWKWGAGDKAAVPNAERIEQTLGELLDILHDAVTDGELDERNEWMCGSGGLEIGYLGRGQFLMSFSVEEWIERSDYALTLGEEENNGGGT